MASTNMDIKEQEASDAAAPKNPVEGKEEQQNFDQNSQNPILSSEQEEEIIREKYGGMLPKKKPLISKDHERAFFDSADWALGKQGRQKPRGPVEGLRPKLEPTPHHQIRSRRSAYAPSDDDGDADDGSNNQTSPEDENRTSQGETDDNPPPENQSCHSQLPV